MLMQIRSKREVYAEGYRGVWTKHFRIGNRLYIVKSKYHYIDKYDSYYYDLVDDPSSGSIILQRLTLFIELRRAANQYMGRHEGISQYRDLVVWPLRLRYHYDFVLSLVCREIDSEFDYFIDEEDMIGKFTFHPPPLPPLPMDEEPAPMNT
jgi:hypothetical protein